MNNSRKLVCATFTALFLGACSQVLETVDLKIETSDDTAQEDFSVVEKTLTFSTAKQANKDP